MRKKDRNKYVAVVAIVILGIVTVISSIGIPFNIGGANYGNNAYATVPYDLTSNEIQTTVVQRSSDYLRTFYSCGYSTNLWVPFEGNSGSYSDPVRIEDYEDYELVDTSITINTDCGTIPVTSVRLDENGIVVGMDMTDDAVCTRIYPCKKEGGGMSMTGYARFRKPLETPQEPEIEPPVETPPETPPETPSEPEIPGELPTIPENPADILSSTIGNALTTFILAIIIISALIYALFRLRRKAR